MANVVTTKKGKQVRLYLYDEDQPRLAELTRRTGLTETAAMTMIASAGLRALQKVEYRMSLPLNFRVSDSAEETLGPRGIKPTKEKIA